MWVMCDAHRFSPTFSFGDVGCCAGREAQSTSSFGNGRKSRWKSAVVGAPPPPRHQKKTARWHVVGGIFNHMFSWLLFHVLPIIEAEHDHAGAYPHLLGSHSPCLWFFEGFSLASMVLISLELCRLAVLKMSRSHALSLGHRWVKGLPGRKWFVLVCKLRK